jgi:hypothetical protein
MARVAEVMLHPEVRPFIGDDFTPSDWVPVDRPEWVYLMAPGVVFLCIPLNTVLWECHVAALPSVRGDVEGAGRDAVRWMFENTPAQSLVAMVPKPNVAAGRFAEKLGMLLTGRLSRAFMRNGTLCDLLIYGVSK